jgi:hypothetical protein
MGQTALIDGDPLVYICGFAVESAVHETPDGEVFPTPAPARKHCEAIGCDPNEINRIVEAEPKSHVLHLVKNYITRTLDKTSATDYRLFLSGNEVPTFRDLAATIQPYKGNRAGVRPFHYDTIRDYMVDVWEAEVVHTIEADDAMGIAMCGGGNKDVICTIDKDLDMIPGMHYNYQTEKFRAINDLQAMYSFYRQLLTGDPVDNIAGIRNMGPKTADKLLAGKMTEEDMFWTVLQAYVEAPEYYKGYWDALYENGALLWIMREANDVWTPPW